MIRTTISLEENLYKKARKQAIDQSSTFAEVVNEALNKYYSEKKEAIDLTGTQSLEKLAGLGKKYNLKGPKDLAKNHDKYLWDNWKK